MVATGDGARARRRDPVIAHQRAGARHLDIEDNGAGFTSETAKKALEPFFTTRNVGLGLGLTVAHKIIETHQGKLNITVPENGEHGRVRISLPLEASTNS